MLEIKHKHHLHLPHLPTASPRIALSPVAIDDDDELTVAIENDQASRDDQWELDERPDMGELTEFWDAVVDDVSKDPEWFKFSEE
ncbi:TPA: hypothetical protein DCF80_04285 [Candidatus Saccharibacteria bacterium]|nr:hypothetical protein [Candidatus Saccharibacteria bacterium]HRK41382.1 hypothetical protein [Candidatus Saccharibacteria bacterium]